MFPNKHNNTKTDQWFLKQLYFSWSTSEIYKHFLLSANKKKTTTLVFATFAHPFQNT